MPACPVCSGTAVELWSEASDFEYFSTEKNYSYYRCRDCFTLFIDPIPVGELHRIYPPNYYSFVDAKKNIVTSIKEWLDRRFFKNILRSMPQQEIRVLDIGGGTGWLSDLIRKTDSRVVHTQIVDIDPTAGALAGKNGHRYFEGTLEAFDTQERFDLILMLNLIEHVQDPLAMLNKAARLLSPQGRIVIKTPNTESLDARLFRPTYWGGLHAPRHWVIFSEKSFRILLKKTRLRIAALRYTQGGPFWAFSLIAAGYRKGWLKVSKERPVIFHPLFPLIAGMTAAFDFVRSLFSKTSQMFILLEHLEKP